MSVQLKGDWQYTSKPDSGNTVIQISAPIHGHRVNQWGIKSYADEYFSVSLWLFPAQYRANKYIASLIEVLAGLNQASGQN